MGAAIGVKYVGLVRNQQVSKNKERSMKSRQARDLSQLIELPFEELGFAREGYECSGAVESLTEPREQRLQQGSSSPGQLEFREDFPWIWELQIGETILGGKSKLSWKEDESVMARPKDSECSTVL